MALQKKNKSGWQIGVAMLAAGLMSTACADMDAAADESVENAAQQTATAHADLGKGDGKDVVTIGDSWMSNTLGTGDAISGGMRRLTKQPYRNYAVQGVLLLQSSLFGPAIPTQWDSAVRAGKDIKTVLMTAGGNDVIQNATLSADCKIPGATCKAKLKEISAALSSMWKKMADGNVQDVVYIGYTETTGSAAPEVVNATKNGVSDACAAAPLRCHLIDSTPIVKKSDLLADSIHPNQPANDRLAKAIYTLMESEGVRR